MQDLYKYVDLGRPLTIEEVDTNWDRIVDAVANLEDGALPIRGVGLVEDSTGQHLTFLDENGDVLATIPFPAAVMQTGEWTSGAGYTTRSIVTHEGGTYLAASQHLAGTDFWDDFDAGRWIQLGAGGAAAVVFQPGNSGMESDTVQDAILELHDLINGGDGVTAATVAFDRTNHDLGNGYVQSAIDELATIVETLQSDAEPPTAAEVAFTPVSGTTATDIQAALADVFEALADVGSGGGTDDQTAVEVAFTPVSGLTSTNVQAAIVEVKELISSGGTDDQTAAQVTFTPPSGMTSTNVQAAIEELKSSGSGGGDTVSAGDITVDTHNMDIIGGTSMSLQDALQTLVYALAGAGAIAAANVSFTRNGMSGGWVEGDDVQAALNSMEAAIGNFESRIAALENAA